jgi:hypothetical protein
MTQSDSTANPMPTDAIGSVETPPSLGYVQRPALPFIGRHRKKLIFLALCLAVAIPLYRYWQPLKHRVLWMYWFKQSEAHVMPKQAVDLIIDDPIAGQKAIKNDRDYSPMVAPSTGAGYTPEAFRALVRYDSRLLVSTGARGGVVPFFGVLHRPDGTPRLVLVAGGQGITGSLLAFTQVVVLPIPKWTDAPPSGVYGPMTTGFGYSGPPPTPTRFKTGVVDSNDPSHIVFEFEAGQRGGFLRAAAASTQPWTVSATGIIDAYLKNDDSITFSLRSFTGTDPNIRVGQSSFSGDVDVIQAQAAVRRGAVRAGTQAATRASRSGRGRSQ